MRIAHITGSLTTLGGGVSLAVIELATALQREGCDVELHGLADDGEPFSDIGSYKTHFHPVTSHYPWPRAHQMRTAIAGCSASVLHSHGLWTDASVSVNHAYRRHGMPYVVSPHGMLDKWALRNSAWKKRIAEALFESRHLRHASVIHALCESERQSIREYGLTNPIALIPNGVRLPELCPAVPVKASTRYLLFLGRLHPKKGLTEMLDAWVKMFSKPEAAQLGWCLVIAGWDQGEYRAELMQRCRDAGVEVNESTVADYLAVVDRKSEAIRSGSVVFVGSAFGDDKDQLFRHANGFLLPSFSEGLPMAVLEAWSYRLPVVMTDFCNLPEGFAAKAALRIEPNAVSIGNGIDSLIRMNDQERTLMGLAGRRLVESKFTWSSVAHLMVEVYRWCLGEVDRPAFVEVI